MGKTLARIIAPFLITGALAGCARTPDYTKDYAIFETWKDEKGTFYVEVQDLDNIKSAYILEDNTGKVVYDLNEESFPFPRKNLTKYIEPQELKEKGINPKDNYSLVIEDGNGKVSNKKIKRTVSETLGDKIGSFFFNLLFPNFNLPLGPY